ncbi:carboxypeptidase-like regulatory domain-containing protein [Leifsonia sp. YIM 134122]|uniref:Carboxypeptidase-like regulatory domain-containing protein n=1 Tax=Leifsonia stereocauli TaxID=3134136 RepID=A0ABU9W237_9MICO
MVVLSRVLQRIAVFTCLVVVCTLVVTTRQSAAVADTAASRKGSISGAISDSTGRPLGGPVDVVVQKFEGGVVVQHFPVTSADDGSFEVDGLPTGSYRVEFDDAGFANDHPYTIIEQYFGGSAVRPYGTEVMVTAGTVRSLGMVRLVGGGSVSGSWTCPTCETIDGISSVSADLFDPATGQWIGVRPLLPASVGNPSTDPDGYHRDGGFSANGLYPGTYRMRINYSSVDGRLRGAVSAPFDISAHPRWQSTEVLTLDLKLYAIQGPAGRLVRVAGQPEVYLSDRLDGLIHIANYGSVSDLGFPTAVSLITVSQLRAATIAPASLTGLATCGDGVFLSSGGIRRLIPAASRTGRPVTVLPPEICAALPGVPVPLPTPIFLKGSNSPVVSLLEGGALRSVPNPATLASIRSGRPTTVVTPTALATFPAGEPVPAIGTLVKDPAHATVYLVDTPRSFVPVRAFQSVLDMGLQRSVTTLPTAVVGQTAKAPVVLSNFVRCNGASWLASGGALLPMRAAAAGSAPVTNLSTWLCTQQARPSSHAADGARLFIRATGAARVYLVSGGVKQAVSSPAVLKRLAPSGAAVNSVDSAFVSSLRTGATLR